MTSSNVSNLLIHVKQVDMSVSTDKASTNNTGLFEKTLKNVADNVPNTVDSFTNSKAQQPNANAKPELSGKSELKEKPKAMEDINSKSEITEVDNGEVESKEIDEEIVEKVEEVVEEVVNVIKDKLDVTDEDIELAMENLGLTFIDLLNPQSLAQVVGELTGETNSFALVMSEDFKGILDQVTELTNQLFEDTKMTFFDIKEQFTSVESLTTVDFTETITPEAKIDLPKEMQPTSDENVEVLEDAGIEVVDEQIKPVNINENQNNNQVTNVITEESKTTNDNGNESLKQEFGFDSQNQKNVSRPNPEAGEVKEAKIPVFREDAAPTMQNANVEYIPENEVVTLPTGESVKASDIANQLIERARVITDTESTTMEMTLNPEGLGKIFVEVSQKGDQITAKIFTENDAVKQALEAQMANLKVEMSSNSTKVTSIEVSVGTHEFERNLEENQRDDSRRDEQSREQGGRRRNRIDMNNLDEISGLMSDEELLIAQMMRDNGGTLDFMA